MKLVCEEELGRSPLTWLGERAAANTSKALVERAMVALPRMPSTSRSPGFFFNLYVDMRHIVLFSHECNVKMRLSFQEQSFDNMKEQVVLVTGASRGIGRAIAEKFSERGYRVFGTTRKTSSTGTAGSVLRLDVRDEVSVEECVNSVLAQAGRIDFLINNAGVSIYGAVEELSLAQVKDLFETNSLRW